MPVEGIDPETWFKLIAQWEQAAPLEVIGIHNVRAMMCGVARECPFGGNPKDCCLYRLRQKPYAERVKWVLALEEQEIRAIYHHHQNCSRCKEGDPGSAFFERL